MNNLTVTSSPHFVSGKTTRSIMLDVVIALLPASAAAVYFFGLRSLLLIAVCVVSCVGFEALYSLLLKKKQPIGDLSAVVTGMLLAMNLPSTLPIWMAVIGSFVAIVIVKQLFGGIGCNFMNPALAGRVVLAISFAGAMTSYGFPKGAIDVLSSATPLQLVKFGGAESLDALTLFLGNHGGVLGETSCAALLLGGIYLCFRRVIYPTIPLAYIGSTLLFAWAFGCSEPLLSILSGGLFLGAIFMATDYVTSPYTPLGKLLFGIGCGLLTALIRTYANSTEGVSYAILLMNLLVPYINDLCRTRPFGTQKVKKEKATEVAKNEK